MSRVSHLDRQPRELEESGSSGRPGRHGGEGDPCLIPAVQAECSEVAGAVRAPRHVAVRAESHPGVAGIRIGPNAAERPVARSAEPSPIGVLVAACRCDPVITPALHTAGSVVQALPGPSAWPYHLTVLGGAAMPAVSPGLGSVQLLVSGTTSCMSSVTKVRGIVPMTPNATFRISLRVRHEFASTMPVSRFAKRGPGDRHTKSRPALANARDKGALATIRARGSYRAWITRTRNPRLLAALMMSRARALSRPCQ